MRKLLAVLTLGSLVLAGCGGSSPSEPPTPSLSGGWIGSFSTVNISMTLVERDQEVAGSGNMAGGALALAFTASGTHAYPNFSLTLRATGYEDLNFTGRFRDEYSISGTLNGSGFNGQTVQLVRQ